MILNKEKVAEWVNNATAARHEEQQSLRPELQAAADTARRVTHYQLRRPDSLLVGQTGPSVKPDPETDSGQLN